MTDDGRREGFVVLVRQVEEPGSGAGDEKDTGEMLETRRSWRKNEVRSRIVRGESAIIILCVLRVQG